jgi:hypothetical protein
MIIHPCSSNAWLWKKLHDLCLLTMFNTLYQLTKNCRRQLIVLFNFRKHAVTLLQFSVLKALRWVFIIKSLLLPPISSAVLNIIYIPLRPPPQLGMHCKPLKSFPPREYWMIYREPGVLGGCMIRLLPLPPSSVIKLALFLSLLVCRRSSLLTGEGGGGRWSGRSQIIRPRECLALYKSFNTFWSRLSPSHSPIGKDVQFQGMVRLPETEIIIIWLCVCVCVGVSWGKLDGYGGVGFGVRV